MMTGLPSFDYSFVCRLFWFSKVWVFGYALSIYLWFLMLLILWSLDNVRLFSLVIMELSFLASYFT